MKKNKTPKGLISGEFEACAFNRGIKKLDKEIQRTNVMIIISTHIENIAGKGGLGEWDKLARAFVELIEASALNIKKNKEVKNGK
jgi:hypothetical protein